ncbi:hypothetical protein STIUS_v1c01340 [Spiroplasma sp. TIUS-1]|uniref:hypothetical protein n=1 Tax=Spiroplasma sp. TIUS-1 TaxID=216963 RepID=UPI0013987980|nr:hypothetical protein [Spiroplasma sp. TIUS-1]QHX35689.1 hypothetical protein STIUS_v1c01340 [Spiroplasma sp. TIUS-1]
MFVIHNASSNFQKIRSDLFPILNPDNVLKIGKLKLKKLDSQHSEDKNYVDYKHWVLFKWVKDNFLITELFLFEFNKIIKKLKIELTEREKKFVRQLEELVFTTWRPLKEMQIKFKSKEKVNLYQSSCNLHFFNNTKEIEQIGTFDFFYSTSQIIITDKDQRIKHKIKYNNIISITPKQFGIIIECEKVQYLVRGKNKLLTYVMLSRMNKEREWNVDEIPNLYSYFDTWNDILDKIY